MFSSSVGDDGTRSIAILDETLGYFVHQGHEEQEQDQQYVRKVENEGSSQEDGDTKGQDQEKSQNQQEDGDVQDGHPSVTDVLLGDTLTTKVILVDVTLDKRDAVEPIGPFAGHDELGGVGSVRVQEDG